MSNGFYNLAQNAEISPNLVAHNLAQNGEISQLLLGSLI